MLPGQESRPTVLVVCKQVAWEGVMRLPVLLRSSGARIHTFTPLRSSVQRSIYLSKQYTVPTEADLASGLREHLKTHRYSLIIVGDEPTLLALIAARDPQPDGSSWLDGWFPIPDAARYPINTGKADFTAAIAAEGVPVPPFRICHDRTDVQAAARELDFPLVLKTNHGFAGNGVVKAANDDELAAAYRALQDRPPLIVQAYIDGPVGLTHLVYDHGRLLFWLPTYKHICFPAPLGPSCVRRYLGQAGLAAMERIVRRVGEVTGFHGMCGIDWIEREPGDLRVIEFNPRPLPAFQLGARAGVDPTAALRGLLSGKPEPQPSPRPVAAGKELVYLFPQHVRRTVYHREWRQLLYHLPGLAENDVPWCEPKILAAAVRELARQAWRQLRRSRPRAASRLTANHPAQVCHRM